MNNIPNILSITRIFLSFALLFIDPYNEIFFLFYILAGLSDILDGYIARKAKLSSIFGSIIDSIADAVFLVCVIIAIYPLISIPPEIVIWIIFICFIRFISILLIYFKYKKIAILHTYGNKITGFFLFAFIFLSYYNYTDIFSYITCIIATISSIEELLINILSKNLCRDIQSIFFLKTKNN